MKSTSFSSTAIVPIEAITVTTTKEGDIPINKDFWECYGMEYAIELFAKENDIKASSSDVYKRNLHLFFAWVQKEGRDISRLSVADVKAWKDHLFQAGKSSLTVASYLTALRKFYGWVEREHGGVDVTRGIKTPKRVQQFQKQSLKPTQAAALLRHFDPSEHTADDCQGEVCKPSKRNLAIVNLMLRTGLRTIEVVRADVGDIAIKDGRRVLYVHGKGRDSKDRFVMLTDKAFKPIEQYLSERGNVLINEPLFISESHRNSGRRLTTRTISWICKEGLKSEDVQLNGHQYTAHSLRHTTAVIMLSNGAHVEDCQEVLRHASPATTQIYLNSIREERRLKRFAESKIDKAF